MQVYARDDGSLIRVYRGAEVMHTRHWRGMPPIDAAWYWEPAETPAPAPPNGLEELASVPYDTEQDVLVAVAPGACDCRRRCARTCCARCGRAGGV